MVINGVCGSFVLKQYHTQSCAVVLNISMGVQYSGSAHVHTLHNMSAWCIYGSFFRPKMMYVRKRRFYNTIYLWIIWYCRPGIYIIHYANAVFHKYQITIKVNCQLILGYFHYCMLNAIHATLARFARWVSWHLKSSSVNLHSCFLVCDDGGMYVKNSETNSNNLICFSAMFHYWWLWYDSKPVSHPNVQFNLILFI